jgi:hypothetical protein
MNEMNAKKLYVWRLAKFLHSYVMVISADELAAHLNRNGFTTGYGEEFQGGRGTYTLIRETWRWVHDDLGLEDESEAIAGAYVKPDGSHAWDKP